MKVLGQRWRDVTGHLHGAFQLSIWASRALVLRFSGDVQMLRLIILKVILRNTKNVLFVEKSVLRKRLS